MSNLSSPLRAAPAALALVLAVVAALLPAGPAWANATQETIVQDDGALLYRSTEEQLRALDEAQALGADTIKAVVTWRVFAPAEGSARRPRFDAADPAAYPARLWERLDGLVRGARARNLDVILAPAGPVPRWADGCGSSRRNCRPRVAEYGRFVTALARRYSGRPGGEPAVTRWAVWNEPNHGAWLTPQFVRRGGRAVASSPRLYRELVRAFTAAVRGVDGHERDRILLGETAPIARTRGALQKRTIGPQRFLRDLLCLDARGRPLRGAAAREQGCARYRPLAVNGVSHHPYFPAAGAPTRAVGPDDATVDDADALGAIIAAGGRARRLPVGLGLWYTEFGIQSNPPDRAVGVGLGTQAALLNRIERRAFGQRIVRSVSQYLLYDAPTVAAFNTGLRFDDGRAKPARGAFRMPFDVNGGRTLTVFGGVRPAPNATVQTVELQHAAPGRPFRRVRTVTVRSIRGYYAVRTPRRAGLWRARWAGPDGAMVSRGVRVR